MGRIHRLDDLTINHIAAGEVVERPLSVVKELVENALDAGASVVSCDIRNGGISSIVVTDNGCGMDRVDARMAFERHATSKLRTIGDLDAIGTMGFRGEALASIASVSRIQLRTRRPEDELGIELTLEAGTIIRESEVGCPSGTRIQVENLFHNVPARFKFLKKDATEAGHIVEFIGRMALSRPDVSFRLVNQGNELLHTPGNNDGSSTLHSVLGRDMARSLVPLAEDGESGILTLGGYAGPPSLGRSTRQHQAFFLNGRWIRSRVIGAAVDEAYKGRLVKGTHPVVILFLKIPSNLVDVNVHPQKLEVRFMDEGVVFRAVYHALQNALAAGEAVAAFDLQPRPRTGEMPGSRLAEPQAAEPGMPTAGAPGEPIPWLLADSGPPFGIHAESPATDEGQALSAPSPDGPKPQGSGAREDAKPVFGRDLAAARVIGHLSNTYLLLEHGGDLLLLDQHAAHEKILYERLLASALRRRSEGEGMPPVQGLLEPLVIELPLADALALAEAIGSIRSMGFDLVPFGPKSFRLGGVPMEVPRMDPARLLRSLADHLRHGDVADPSGTRWQEALFDAACHGAIKAKDALDPREVDQLLKDLSALEDPYHCPHGRPVILRIERQEIDKRFKRIV